MKTKNPFLSKTMLGILAMVAGFAINKYVGLDLPQDSIAGLLDEILFALGGTLAAYGRFKAETKLKLPFGKLL